MYPPHDVPGYATDDPDTRLEPVTPEALQRCAEIGANFRQRYMAQCWIENDDTGFTGWRWVRHNVTIVIVSAANRYKDIIVMGPRHYSNLMRTQIEAYGGIKVLREYAGDEYEQGFVDQYGTFYTREESLKIANDQGQIRYPHHVPGSQLFSEGLC